MISVAETDRAASSAVGAGSYSDAGEEREPFVALLILVSIAVR